MSSDKHILRAEGLYKSYRMGAAKVKVLEGVDLGVKTGEFVAIVGASGSGKSTLLHILGALDKPNKGAVRFDGMDLGRIGERQLNKFRNKTVGFVFQFYHLLDELNVLENVYLPAMASTGIIGWLGCRRAACRAWPGRQGQA
jgi:ABC-type lipoprotein export system ATPase subunit